MKPVELPRWIVVHLDPADPMAPDAYAVAKLVVNDDNPIYTITGARYDLATATRVARHRRVVRPF